MEPPFSPVLFSVALFIGMMITLGAGRQLGHRREREESEAERDSLGTIEGALFGVFALLVAFTFSGAAERFGQKRMLISEEVGYIRSGYLRLQLVPEKERLVIQELFRRYVDSRLETYRRLPDMQAAAVEMARSEALQKEIWARAVAATQLPDADFNAGEVLLPALNDMINITTTRTLMLEAHPPRIIFELLFVLGLICSLLAGYRIASGRSWSWLHVLGFTLVTVVIVYVILDVEYPRGGLINLESADLMLVKVRADMNPEPAHPSEAAHVN